MNESVVAVFLAVVVPVLLLLYGVKGWYHPAEWKKSIRGGYHSRRVDKSAIHWQVAQREYAKWNICTGVLGCGVAAVQGTLLYIGWIQPFFSIGISGVFYGAYYIFVRYKIEKTLSDHFDQSDALNNK